MNDQTEQLKSYIQQQIYSGITPDEIASQLRTANWSEESIQQAFQALQTSMMPSAVPAAPSTPAASNAQPQTLPQATSVRRGRIRTGWLLLQQSLKIFQANKQLVRYSLMAALWSFIAALVMIICFIFVGAAASSHLKGNGSINVFAYGMVFLMYVVLFFIANLYAAGLAANVLDSFKGQRKSYRDYMRIARSKAGTLLVYALIESTVGLLLRYLVERFRLIGWIVSRILGALWSLGTLFVIPAIVTDEHPNAFRSVKQSVGLFKRTWGEGITAKVTVGAAVAIIHLIMFFGFILVGGGLVFAGGSIFGDTGAAVVGILVLAVWIISLVILSIFATLANSIINTALFYYATYAQVPPAFDANLLNSVFYKPNKRRLFCRK